MRKKIIQVGAAGWGKSWLRFIGESADWTLCGLVSRSESSLHAAREECGLEETDCYTDYDKALMVDADAVLIAAPHALHVPLALKAIEAGKHVIVEKPLSDNFEAALRLADRADVLGRTVIVSQNFRYREALWQMRETVGEELGAISSIDIDLRIPGGDWSNNKAWRVGQESPLIMEIMIHHVDMVRFLLGRNAVSVYCEAWKKPWDALASSAIACIEFEGGVRLDYHGSWAARGDGTGWEGNWLVEGEHGSIRWNQEVLEAIPAKNASLKVSLASRFPGIDRHGLLKEFSDALDEQRLPMSHIRDNLNSLAIIFAALRSSNERRPVGLSEFARGSHLNLG